MTDALLLIAAPVMPLLAAALAMAAPRRLSMLGLAVAAAPALVAGLTAGGAEAELPGFLFGAQLRLEPDLAPALAAIALVWGAAALHGRAEIADGPDSRRYKACFGISMAGQFATLLARDMASFYAGFAALSFAAYGLVAHKGTVEAMRAGRVYAVFVVMGELALFTAFVLIAAAQAGLAPPVETGVSAPALVWWLLLAGFGVKAGLVPLHVWLPLAHPVAPVPASAALSGATLKAGLVGLLVFAPPALAAPPHYGEALIWLGFIGAFGAALLGVAQRDPKVVLAYSSVSQMGLALALLGAAAHGLAEPAPARAAVLLFVVHHALAKAALFLGVSSGAPRMVTLVGLGVAALSLTGAPLTLGYAAKAAAGAAAPVLGPVLSVAAFGTAALMARALWLVVRQAPARTSRIKATAFGALVLGLASAPLMLAASVVPSTATAAAAALAPALAALALGFGLSLLRVRWPAPPPGDLVVLADPIGAALERSSRFTGSTADAPRSAAALQDEAPPDEGALWRETGVAMAVVLLAVALAALGAATR
ncbi:MAG: NADH/ubiquinone/plastoquinone (complex I) [Rhodobacteraceae bacterium]|nr:MAG: NADH/ubiquinone/plastoquinone (complex I) [Paracoccaceae bacterium]